MAPESNPWAFWTADTLADHFASWYKPWAFNPANYAPKRYGIVPSSKTIDGSTELPSNPPSGILHIQPFFEVRKSSKGGYGCFATEDLSSGTEILSEIPFLVCTMGDFPALFPTLSQQFKDQLFQLHWWPGADDDKATAIFMTNRFEFNNSCALLEVGSRFNHACYPNCSYSRHEADGKIVFRVKKYVKKGEEITVSYGHAAYDLWVLYGFMCDCGECAPPTHLLKGESRGIGGGI